MANVKTIFYALRDHFKKNSEKFSQICMGPSCEQWINTEIFWYLNFDESSPLKKSGKEYVLAERKKRDLSIGTGSDKKFVPTHIIENKIIYSNYSKSQIRSRIERLMQQVDSVKFDESCHNIGLIFFISWVKNDDPQKYDRLKKFESYSEDVIEEFLRESSKFTTQHNYERETVFKKTIEYGFRKYDIQCSILYFTRR